MFVSPEEALAVQEARHRLRCTKAGFGWLFCPYTPGACFSIGHYVRDNQGWEQCPGALTCRNHHLRQITKVHVPALVAHEFLRPEKCEGFELEDCITFKPHAWGQKIVELTSGVIPIFCQPSRPDQLALVWRPTGKSNGPLKLRWLNTIMKGVPAGLADMNIKDMLPAIIHGEVRPSAVVSELDKPDPCGIKHKIYSQKDCNDSSLDTESAEDAAARRLAAFAEHTMPRGKGGAK